MAALELIDGDLSWQIAGINHRCGIKYIIRLSGNNVLGDGNSKITCGPGRQQYDHAVLAIRDDIHVKGHFRNGVRMIALVDRDMYFNGKVADTQYLQAHLLILRHSRTDKKT